MADWMQETSGQLPQDGEDAALLLEKEGMGQQEIVIQTESKKKYGDPFEIDVEEKLEKQIVRLQIDESIDNAIRILCFHRDYKAEQQLNIECKEFPQISFDQSIKQKNTAKIFGRMRRFSQENDEAGELSNWLVDLQEELAKKYGESFAHILIKDRTSYEIPWELLEFAKGQFLGVTFKVTRWQDIKKSFDRSHSKLELNCNPQSCSGEVFAYLNVKDLENVEIEKDLIEKKFEEAVIHDDIYDFFDDLEETKDDVALVFMASHGFFGDDLSESALGGCDIKEQIDIDELYEYDFPFLEKSQSVFFVNTCHSGRLQINDVSKISSNPTGFSTFFLKKGAAGVIGSLCEIPDQYAAQVACDFFEQWENNQELTVSEILHRLRIQAFNNYKNPATKKNKKESKYLFLVTFMYIYYGNPMVCLNFQQGGDV